MTGSQQVQLKNNGLSTLNNPLSAVADGSMAIASNVVIDRNMIVEPRRGFTQYGNTFGDGTDRVKQLLSYKDVILRHVLSTLQYDSDAAGTFTSFQGQSTQEIEAGLRIKGLEANGNFYYTTLTGIKKLSARTSADFPTLQIQNAGGAKALDVTVTLDYSNSGFLEANSKVAYRIVWGYNDNNDNLILGSPSSRAVVYNVSTTNSCFTDLSFTIPSEITTNNYFYQVYRTGITTGDLPPVVSVAQEPADPGDEEFLVIQDTPTTMQFTARTVTLQDITPESFRKNGTTLYTNPDSGDGITAANEKPPFAHDIALYKNYTFYANTSTTQTLDFNFLSIENFVSNVTTFSISNGTTTNTYKFQGSQETYTVNFTGSASTDFYNASTGTAKYFTLESANNAIKYCVYWYFSTNDVAPALAGYLNVKIDLSQLGNYQFTTSSANATAGAVYSNNGHNYTVVKTIAGNTTLITDGTGTPLTSGTLTKVSGTGDATITFSAFTTLAVTDIISATANGILLATNDFNISGSGTVLSIPCSNNGFVTNSPTTTVVSPFSVTKDGLGTGQDAAAKKIFLPIVPTGSENGPTTSQQLEQVATSMVNVLNQEDSIVYAYYQSGFNDVPGEVLLAQQDTTGPAFWITSDQGQEFTPTLPVSGNAVSSTNEISPNRIFYSKLQQPEAVPLGNYFDVGPKDREIKRIIALRDSLFIFKEDGIYRLSGDTSSAFVIAPFDFSTQVLAPDTAVVLNNQIYAMSTQGVCVVTDTGVQIISRPIENQLLKVARLPYNYQTASFGVSYETDRSYILWTVTNPTDQVATQAFRYNTFTSCWTSWDKTQTAGIVNFGDDKLYLGAGDINLVEKERKALDRHDHADRQYDLEVLLNGVNGPILSLDSVALVNPGDVVIQTQYLTGGEFNQLLDKLDRDIGVGDKNYVQLLTYLAGQDMRSKLNDLTLKLDADSKIVYNQFNSDIGDYSYTISAITPSGGNTILTTTAPHDIKVGRWINISGTNSTPTISGTYKVIAVSSTTITIAFTLISAGTAGTVQTAINDFRDMQACFNIIVNDLNNDDSVFYTNYPSSNGSTNFEVVVLSVNKSQNQVTLKNGEVFLFGEITLYKAIESVVIWNPVFFGDPSMTKQVREGTMIFEDSNFSKVTISYATDLSPRFAPIVFTGPGLSIGDWGYFNWGGVNWGGISAPIPLRTYIPLDKQRCRFMNIKFDHKVAFEKYALYGSSLTYRNISARGYR